MLNSTKTYRYHDITLIGGQQMWSNPEAMWTEKSIPVVLTRPTFLSLVLLAGLFGKEKLVLMNESLFQEKSITAKQHARNDFWLSGIAAQRDSQH
jgi:hypothetical protein